MLFNSIEFILGISLGFFEINHAADHKVTGPTVVERNCTHITFSLEIQYVEDPKLFGIIEIYADEFHDATSIYQTGFNTLDNKKFYVVKDSHDPRYKDVSYRVEPIPDTWRDKHTMYITFPFPDDHQEYLMTASNICYDWLASHGPSDKIAAPFKVGKSRCHPQDGITGCDPYCVCDTAVQTQCEDGSSISGKCSDTRSLTDNSASYIFNEACASSSETSKPFSSSSGGSKPFSSTESSSGKSTPSQFSKSTIGIVAAAIIGVLAIVAIACYRKKKKGYPSTLSDE